MTKHYNFAALERLDPDSRSLLADATMFTPAMTIARAANYFRKTRGKPPGSAACMSASCNAAPSATRQTGARKDD
jgi:hypothetical protein